MSLLILSLTRVEYVIFIPISFVFWILVKRKKLNLKKENIRYWIKNLFWWIVIIPPFLYSFYRLALVDKFSIFDNSSGVGFGISNFPDTASILISAFSVTMLIIFLLSLFISIFWMYKEKKLEGGLFLISVGFLFSIVYSMTSYLPDAIFILLYSYSFFIFAIPVSILLDSKGLFKKVIGLITILSVSIIFLSLSVQNAYGTATSYYYLSTASPEIIEKNIQKDCLIITPYARNLNMGTFLNVEYSNILVRDGAGILDNSCSYFFEDFLCWTSNEKYGMKECNYIKENFYLEPHLIIQGKKSNIKYTLYRISDTEINTNAEDKDIKIFYVDE